MGTPKERRYVRVAGVSPDIDIVPFINSLDTLLRAVTERVFMVKDGSGGFKRPPRPEPDVFEDTMVGVSALLDRLLPSTAPISHQDFVDRYTGRKKRVYSEALEEMRAGRTTLAEDAAVKVFVKYEKTDRTSKSDPVPRVISPRNPRYNIRLGRYVAPLEKKVYRALGKLFHPKHPAVMKGFNAQDTADILHQKWLVFNNPVAVGLDAERFDQHVSRDALKWKHARYVRCFPEAKHKRRLSTLLKHQLVNHCSGTTPDGAVKYDVDGTTMSGDIDTSLGACALMCSMVKAFSMHTGIVMQLANNGDDCVLFLESRDYDRLMVELPGFFLKLGFKMVVEPPAYVFEHLEFCQTKPVFDGERYVMCRNPRTAIAKDSVMLKNWDTAPLFAGWLDAVGTGGLALAARLPVFQSLYSSYVRSGKKRNVPKDLLPWSFRTMFNNMRRSPGIVLPEARCSFWEAFDVTPDEQLELERYYDRFHVDMVPRHYRCRPVFE